MTTTINVRFKVRGRTAAEHTSLNEVLLERELGLETDTRKFKFGDGATPWNDLDYAAPSSLALGGATLGTNVLAVSGNTNLTASAGVTLETSSSVATASAYVRVIRAMSTVIGGASTGVAFGYKMNAGGTAPEAAFVNSQAGMPLLLGVNGGTNDQLALNADGSAVLKGVLKLTNQSEPATPTGGGVIYVEAGTLKYKGSSGTVTTLGAA